MLFFSVLKGAKMQKSCKYCGGVHDIGYVCPKKPSRKFKKRQTKADKFRSSYDWKQKRQYILKRDNYLCRACFSNLPGTIKRLNSDNLSVHHIKPLKDDFDARLDDENLITLCALHHTMAEEHDISSDLLISLIPPTSDE